VSAPTIKRIRETPVPHALYQHFVAMGAASIRRLEADLNDGTGYSVLLGREPLDETLADMRWHLSIAHPSRLPEWRHLAEIAHEVRPGVVFVMALPPKSWWINIHDYCLHLWEVKDDPLVDSWRREGRGDAPT
jgi:hypothetical protein